MTLKVVYFGNSGTPFSNRHFSALRAAPCDVVAIVDVPPARQTSTNPHGPAMDLNLVEYAKQDGIPVFEPGSPNSAEFVRLMRDLHPDLFVAVGYMNLLKDEILTVPRLLAANFHASLLPAYRGKHPLFWALRNGERRVGLTVHMMSSGLDMGDILYQVTVLTKREDSVASLYDRVMERSLALVRRLIADAEDCTLHPRSQPVVGASYYSSVLPEDFHLRWSCPAETLRRWVCASPGKCFFEVAGRRVFCIKAETVRQTGAPLPGQILGIGRRHCIIATGEGSLCVRTVRMDGGADLLPARLCRGTRSAAR